MRKLPSLNALKAFESAARLSSITQAADELRVSHSSISQQIKQLELYFGQKLFLRRGRGIEPTGPALAFLEDVRFCFDRIASSSEQLAARGERRAISINATPSFLMRWLIPRSSLFQIANPDIRLNITTSYTDDHSHISERFDVLIRRDEMHRSDHVCRKILDDVSTPVTSPEFLERHLLHRPADLLQHPLLHMRSRSDAWNRWFKEHGVETGATIGGPIFDHFFLTLEAAINGLGIAMGPLALIEEDIRQGRLCAPFPDRTLEGPGFHILYRKKLAREAAGRAFLGWLAQETKSDIL